MKRPTILCIASYYKGNDFLRRCHDEGARVIMITVEEIKDEGWPRDAIDDFRWMPDLLDRRNVLNAVSWLARTEKIDLLVPLDEFDLGMAAVIREHLAIPGMSASHTLSFRDKLRMRIEASAGGIPVPEFTPLVHDPDIDAWAKRVPAPWMLKPRGDAATKGIRRLEHYDELWPALDALGDQRSHHLLERFVPGDVFHVDGIVADGKLVFAEANAYAKPPFEVTRGGGMFMSRTLERDGDTARILVRLAGQLVQTLGLPRGAIHAEFIQPHGSSEPMFLEIAARVGGAHIADMVEAATGVNLWAEWASVELAHARGEAYRVPTMRQDHAGIIVSLARQEWPDSSTFDAPEIVWRMNKHHHIGMVVRSQDPNRVRELQQQYGERIARDYSAYVPET